MLTSWPAARATLTFLQFLLGSANATVSGDLLLGVLDPADELVAGQGRDVVPGVTCRGVGDERLAQVAGQFVHYATGQSGAPHKVKVVGPGRSPSPRPVAEASQPTGVCGSKAAAAWTEWRLKSSGGNYRAMDPRLSRVIWHQLECINAVTYFSPECREAPVGLGLRGFWMGYFACRAAPLGPVGAPVVEATFFNFHPARVHRAIPDAWNSARPRWAYRPPLPPSRTTLSGPPAGWKSSSRRRNLAWVGSPC